jgi:hypothetical protein
MMSGTRSPEEYHHTADDDEPAQLGSPWRTPPASPGRRSSPTSRAGSRYSTRADFDWTSAPCAGRGSSWANAPTTSLGPRRCSFSWCASDFGQGRLTGDAGGRVRPARNRRGLDRWCPNGRAPRHTHRGGWPSLPSGHQRATLPRAGSSAQARRHQCRCITSTLGGAAAVDRQALKC